MPSRLAPPALALLLAVPLLIALAPSAGAHNPALTTYEPVQLGDGVLVLGEEGTATLVGPEGDARWQANLSVHVTHAPVASGDAAATVARTVPGGVPMVQAFGADGPTWNVTLGEAGAFGVVAPMEDGFLAISTQGHLVALSTDGEIRHEAGLPFGVRVDPVPAPGEGWLVASPGRTLARITATGDVLDETRLGGTPTDLAATDEQALVAIRGQPRGTPAVQALAWNLTTRWIHDEQGLRIGGDVQATGDRVVYGTYDPSGARVVALDAATGQPLWNTTVGEDTAVAVTAHEGSLYAAGNSKLIALTSEGEPRWQVNATPRIASPAVLGAHVYPSGAENTMVAVDTLSGETAWTFTDGVSQVPWSDEDLGPNAPGGSTGTDGGTAGTQDATSLAPVLAVGAVGLAALVRRRQP